MDISKQNFNLINQLITITDTITSINRMSVEQKKMLLFLIENHDHTGNGVGKKHDVMRFTKPCF